MSVKWRKTSKNIFYSIFNEYIKDDLKVFGSCSAPESNPRIGIENPYMNTEWGFENSSEPIIRCLQTKETKDQKIWDEEYFIAISKYKT